VFDDAAEDFLAGAHPLARDSVGLEDNEAMLAEMAATVVLPLPRLPVRPTRNMRLRSVHAGKCGAESPMIVRRG